jgi:hypothetical protein
MGPRARHPKNDRRLAVFREASDLTCQVPDLIFATDRS